MAYKEDDMLMLSGIQHYMFCPRQWALIHIEQQWQDNRLTIEGEILHTHVDNPFYRQKNGNVITLRSVPIASKLLGLYGVSDIIELHSSRTTENTINHTRYPGRWIPYPVEYKRGHKKVNACDEVQLAAQVMCLEEMYQVNLDHGALFYGEIRHRELIQITSELRQLVMKCSCEMHQIYDEKKLPKADKKAHCKNCSLMDLCIPSLSTCKTVEIYLNESLYEKTT